MRRNESITAARNQMRELPSRYPTGQVKPDGIGPHRNGNDTHDYYSQIRPIDDSDTAAPLVDESGGGALVPVRESSSTTALQWLDTRLRELGEILSEEERDKEITRHIADYQERRDEVYQALRRYDYVEGIPEEAYDDPNGWRVRYVSPREHEVTYEIAKGNSNRGIARVLGISDQTVKNHVTKIIEKLGASSREDVVAKAIAAGIVNPAFVPVDFDFTRLSDLTPRVTDVYDQFTVPGEGYSNREIADSLYITEQTVKNHMTTLRKDLGISRREHIRLFEIKRKEFLNSLTREDISLSPSQRERLQMLFYGMDDREIATNLGIDLEVAQKDREDIYTAMYAGNLLQMMAHSVHFGFFPRELIADERSFAAADALSSEDREFLVKAGSYTDHASNEARANKMNMDVTVFKERLLSIKDKLQVSGIKQAVIVGIISDLSTPYPVGPLLPAEAPKPFIPEGESRRGRKKADKEAREAHREEQLLQKQRENARKAHSLNVLLTVPELSQAERQILILRAGLLAKPISQRQIAEELGYNPDSIRRRQALALAKLENQYPELVADLNPRLSLAGVSDRDLAHATLAQVDDLYAQQLDERVANVHQLVGVAEKRKRKSLERTNNTNSVVSNGAEHVLIDNRASTITISPKTSYEWLVSQRDRLALDSVRTVVTNNILQNAQELAPGVPWEEALKQITTLVGKTRLTGDTAIRDRMAAPLHTAAAKLGWSTHSPEFVIAGSYGLADTFMSRASELRERIVEPRSFISEEKRDETLTYERALILKVEDYAREMENAIRIYSAQQGLPTDQEYQDALRRVPSLGKVIRGKWEARPEDARVIEFLKKAKSRRKAA